MQTIGCAKIDRSDRLGEHISRNNARTTDITKYDCGFAIIQQISYHWSGVEPSTVIGEAGESTQLGGYSIVTADDLETAISMAKHCPTLSSGGGVEVGALAALPAEHPAERMRSALSNV